MVSDLKFLFALMIIGILRLSLASFVGVSFFRASFVNLWVHS